MQPDNVRFVLLRQDLERLLSLRDPALVEGWQPTGEQRTVYAQLLDQILGEVDEYQSVGKQRILREGNVQVEVSDSASVFYRDELEPRIPALKHAYSTIDPDGAELNSLFEGIGAPSGAGGRVRRTFEEALRQVNDLIDRNPDRDFRLLPGAVSEILGSKLIAFDPDSWLDRAGQLAAVRTERKNVLLPAHVRLRLEELHRTYVFGCWLSVFSLARAILEYAILDNLHKFGIAQHWPPDNYGKKREKKLEVLIDEVGGHLPQLVGSMDQLRTYGNDHLHPKASSTSRGALFQREIAAKDALETIVAVTEALYRAPKTERLVTEVGNTDDGR